MIGVSYCSEECWPPAVIDSRFLIRPFAPVTPNKGDCVVTTAERRLHAWLVRDRSFFGVKINTGISHLFLRNNFSDIWIFFHDPLKMVDTRWWEWAAGPSTAPNTPVCSLVWLPVPIFSLISMRRVMRNTPCWRAPWHWPISSWMADQGMVLLIFFPAGLLFTTDLFYKKKEVETWFFWIQKIHCFRIVYCPAVFGHFLDPLGNHPVGQFFRRWILRSRSFRLIDWLVYWICTAWSFFTGAGLKWPSTTGQYNNWLQFIGQQKHSTFQEKNSFFHFQIIRESEGEKRTFLFAVQVFQIGRFFQTLLPVLDR